VVADPSAVRERLLAAGASPGFAGLMLDRRFDRGGELVLRDEVLRLRAFRAVDGSERFKLGWKGPTAITPDGYKARRELEYEIDPAGMPPEELLKALGYEESQRIDRYVEYFLLGSTAVRLEWYPRMDVLLEVEGDAAGIETALRATGLPRSDFTADSLAAFAARYAARTGQPAVLALNPELEHPPSWAPR
jgi:adenylate cyclase class IV